MWSKVEVLQNMEAAMKAVNDENTPISRASNNCGVS